jgi:hypothetical protein
MLHIATGAEAPTSTSTAGETGLTPAVAELVPFHHHGAWLSLPIPERERVKELMAVMVGVEGDPAGVVRVLQCIARQNHGRKGWAFGTLRTKYYAWRDAGRDWQALAAHYRHDSGLPAEFVDFLSAMVLREHRSQKQAIHRVRELWREGGTVPGYGTWREWFAQKWPNREVPRHFTGDYPQGWSDANLYNRMPSRARHALATRGRAAAERLLPHIQRDPGGLRFLELVTIDDFECDVKCIHGRKVVGVRGVLVMDVATRTHLAVLFKPMIEVEGDEGRRRISITRMDVQALLGEVFARWGVPEAHPMTLLVENAAAAVTDELEAALDIFFNGQVRVSRTGILSYKTAANGFIEKGGRPNEKGWIESYFNLMHNRAGNLPGQKGSRYDNKPGDLKAKEDYVKKLAAYECDDETFRRFRSPFLSFDELAEAYGQVFRWMDNRTEHRLLGFDQVLEWREGPGELPKPIESLNQLPPAAQELVEVLPPRMESPVERREKLRRDAAFEKVPEPVLALLAFRAKKTEVKKDNRVTFTLRDTGYTYVVLAGDDGLRTRAGAQVGAGEKITAYFDEETMARIYCFTAEGGYLGTLSRLGGPVSIKDPAAISAAAAAVARYINREIEGPVRRLLAGDRAAAEADRAHNAALVEREGLEKAKPRRLSATLADDRYEAGAGDRFGAAMRAAGAIGASAHRAAERAALAGRQREQAARITDEDKKNFLGIAGEEEPGAPAETNAPGLTANEAAAGEETLGDYL